MIIIHVDDMMVIGHRESMKDVQERVEKVFSIKTENNLTDYLGCEFHMSRDKIKGWLVQPSIIRSLEKKFSEEAMKDRLGLTPETPRFIAMRGIDQEDKLPAKNMQYTKVGLVLCYISPNIADMIFAMQ